MYIFCVPNIFSPFLLKYSFLCFKYIILFQGNVRLLKMKKYDQIWLFGSLNNDRNVFKKNNIMKNIILMNYFKKI